MNVLLAVRMYVSKMIQDSGPGMKVLLMDRETIGIVSVAYAQSEILQKEVYLFEQIDKSGNGPIMKHLKCVVFLRPSQENVQLLASELKSPRYGVYYIYFSGIISKASIKVLAESDEQEVVREIQEFYADFFAVGPHLFSLNLEKPIHGMEWNPNCLQRSAQGVLSVLLSLKKNPIIRYQNFSSLARRLAENIRDTILKESSLFHFHRGESIPLLLILDRRYDPITPLLNQWTYQAMVHELLSIKNNRVSLVGVPGAPKDMSEVLLSAEQDEFYANNMYLNFGDIGQTIKSLMDEFQTKAKSHQKVESIADMKAFVENYPQFKKMSGAVTKHVTLVGELSRLVTQHNLLEVSEAEQELACQEEHTQSLTKIRKLLVTDQIRDLDAARLVFLYAIRYHKHPSKDIVGLVDLLRRRGTPVRLIDCVEGILRYASSGETAGSSILTTKDVTKITEKIFKGLKGVENVFTQHSPVLKEILDNMVKGRLTEEAFPTVSGGESTPGRIQDVVIFIVGGVTHEESLAVHQFCRVNTGIRIALGGTLIHNSQSFISDVEAAVKSLPAGNAKYPHNSVPSGSGRHSKLT
uniref:Vacuolar protein sorting-associated protein 45 n=1 Tax=Daphnia sinensis TaxID=1820382 RepID=A0A4Y7NFJ7_9CRUS|nr:EOG090X03QA [Daphnia sinensis]SVE89172.1 EOG090X03QA [Daphnia sinensis]SVE91048.1 EOG090X03QA [Daphnia sinensis]SVE91673.1 EOG090X03QA [Daphnia sinensis]